MKMRARLIPLVCALSLGWFAGCGSEPQEGAPTGTKSGAAKGAAAVAKLEAPEFLKLIPADTPYVIANYEPIPQEVIDKFATAIQPLLAQLDKEIEKELANTTADTPEDKLGRAILEELKGNLNAQGLEKLGIGKAPIGAVYGIGVLPVFRIQLAKPENLRAVIGRIEQKSGQKAPVKKMGEQEYWTFSEDGFTVAAAIVGKDLVLTFAPDAIAEKVIGLALGVQKPEKSLADAGALTEIIKKYGFTPYGVGLIDSRQIAKTLLGDAQGIHAEVITALQTGGGLPTLSDPCKKEIMGLVDKAPRMVFGYPELSARQLTAHYIVELEGGLAKELAGLRAKVPGLASVPEGAPLLAFGAGLDVSKALEFAKQKATAIQQSPFQCELFADLNQGAGQLATQLQQAMIPPVVLGLDGFYVVVREAQIEGGDVGPQTLQTAKAYGVISTEKPLDLITTLKTMLPQLQGFDVKADAKPVPLPAGALPPGMPTPQVAVGEAAIAISIGQGVEADLPKILKAKAGEDLPLLTFTYDQGKFLEMVNAQMRRSLEHMPPEFKAKAEAEMKADQAVTNALAKVIGTTTYSLLLDEKGLVLVQNVQLD